MSDSFFDLVKHYPVIFAGVFGIIPAVIWLWFWLKEDIHPEPTKMLIFTFLAGCLSVFLAIPLQHLGEDVTSNTIFLFCIWACIEEALKWGSAWIGGLHTWADDEPIDPLIYMIVAALGFVAMENTLFLVTPLISGNIGNALITGNLRFIGATLLHIMSSAALGMFLAFSFTKTRERKIEYALIGFVCSVILHTLFNLFIIDSAESGMFLTFGAVWVGIVFLLFIFEKTKSIPVIHVQNNS